MTEYMSSNITQLSVQDCYPQYLTTKWVNTVPENTESTVKHGQTINIMCTKKHINLGGKQVTCSDGDFLLSPSGSEPSCTKVGMYFRGGCNPKKTEKNQSQI